MTGTRPLRLLLATIVAVGVLALPAGPVAPPTARAATPDLTIVSAARYDVQPSRHRVHVTVDLTLTNHLSDTVTKRFFFDHAFLAVLPASSGYALSWAGAGTPSVRVAQRTKSYTLLRLDLAQHLTSGKTAIYKLTFDLADPGGAPTRDLRVGDTLVSFPVWAFASDATPGSSVTVVFPAGYQIQVEAGGDPGAHDQRGWPRHLPQRRPGQATRVLRVPGRRSARGLRVLAPSRRPCWTRPSMWRCVRGRTTRRGRRRSAPSSARACPSWGGASGCRGRRSSPTSRSRKPSVDRPAATPASSIRAPARSRSRTTPTNS